MTDTKTTEELLDQLETELGVTYSNGHFRKMYSGKWGMDDMVGEAEKVGYERGLEFALSLLDEYESKLKDELV